MTDRDMCRVGRPRDGGGCRAETAKKLSVGTGKEGGLRFQRRAVDKSRSARSQLFVPCHGVRLAAMSKHCDLIGDHFTCVSSTFPLGAFSAFGGHISIHRWIV